jgi:hypothetical protein
MAVWAFSPVVLLLNPTLLGLVAAPKTGLQFAQYLGYLWLAVGVGGLLFRAVQLFVIKDVLTGLAWTTKIVTDPFHDIKLYYRTPLQLVRGGLIARTLTVDHTDETAEFFQ